MQIIFLDVDGILNSMAYFEQIKESGNKLHKNGEFNDISDYHLQMLAKIYHTCEAKIVLSSTWRSLDDSDDNTCRAMYQYLVDELARYDMEIVSKTPIRGFERPLEIKEWLLKQDNLETIDYVILDDDFPEEEYKEFGLEKHLVKTRFFVRDVSEGGLQPEHVEKAIKILQGDK